VVCATFGSGPALATAGIDERPQMALADSWYRSIDNLTTIPNAPELLIPPARHGRQGSRARTASLSVQSDGLRAAMKAKLASDDGKARCAKRRETVEPVFGQLKEHLFSVKNISPPLICASRAREYRSPPVFSMAVFQAHSTWCCHCGRIRASSALMSTNSSRMPASSRPVALPRRRPHHRCSQVTAGSRANASSRARMR